MSATYCRLLYTSKHYFYLVNLTWIFIEAVYLHSLVSSPGILSGTTTEPSVIVKYALFGWGFPLVPTIGWYVNFHHEWSDGTDEGRRKCVSTQADSLLEMWYDIPKCVMERDDCAIKRKIWLIDNFDPKKRHSQT